MAIEYWRGVSWSLLLACGVVDAAPDVDAIGACMSHSAAALGFSGTAYVVSDGAVVTRSFGFADVAGLIPNTASTAFNLASASKMFTAVAIGLLVDRGLVAFDAPIGTYLTGLDPQVAAITVAQLLDHTSGLGNFFEPGNEAAIAAARSPTDLLPLAVALPLSFAAGSKREYSNSGFIVLGAIVEKISQRSYASFLPSELFGPLGMSATRFDMQGAAVPMTRLSPEGPSAPPSPSAHPAPPWVLRSSSAGGIVSTPADLAAFLTALQEGRLLGRATTATLWKPRPDPSGRSAPHGSGFTVRASPRLKIGHGGGAPGISSDVALFPDSGAEAIVLSNGDPPSANRLAAVLEQAMFAEDVESSCASALAHQLATPATPPRRPS